MLYNLYTSDYTNEYNPIYERYYYRGIFYKNGIIYSEEIIDGEDWMPIFDFIIIDKDTILSVISDYLYSYNYNNYSGFLKEKNNYKLKKNYGTNKMKNYLILFVITIFLASCFAENENIDMVKNGSLNKYPNVTIGEVVDTVFDKVKWEAIIGEDGNKYVNMRGYLLDGSKALFQFRIIYDSSWRLHALELDDEPSDINIVDSLYYMYVEMTE